MENIIAYIGAAVSTIGAVAAWFFNHEMKKYELAQARTTKILEKRFECYPRIWELCQTFLTKLTATDALDKREFDTFSTDLLALYQKDGLYYSQRLQKEIEEFIADGRSAHATEWYGKEVLKGRIRGNTRHTGILVCIQDDLGAYTSSAASVLAGRP
jgi:hypothetical protein